MATISGLFSPRDTWLLQKFTQCHLATEETLRDRIEVGVNCWGNTNWFTDDGAVKHAWHKSGHKAYRVNFKDGKRHGLSEGFQWNGEKSWRNNYKNGKYHGLHEEWHCWCGGVKISRIYHEGNLICERHV